MLTDDEPFGDTLFDKGLDLTQLVKTSIRIGITGIDTQRQRAHARLQRLTDYKGGRCDWQSAEKREAA